MRFPVGIPKPEAKGFRDHCQDNHERAYGKADRGYANTSLKVNEAHPRTESRRSGGGDAAVAEEDEGVADEDQRLAVASNHDIPHI